MHARVALLAVALSIAPACSSATTQIDDAGGADSGLDGGAPADTGVDSGTPPADTGTDTGTPPGDGGTDTGTPPGDSGPPDVGAGLDAGPMCGDAMQPGWCPSGLTCLSCPTGPIMEAFLCTTMCTSDADCTDASRPHCAIDTFSHATSGICTPPSITCRFGVVCASPDTMIATPSGERPIADLVAGDLVYSADHGTLRAVPLEAVYATPVFDHRVVRVELDTGRVLEISPGHPTADGRSFGDLRAGDRLDGALVLSAELVPYTHATTHDILPASDTATYVAGGALIGSTLARSDAPVALTQ